MTGIHKDRMKILGEEREEREERYMYVLLKMYSDVPSSEEHCRFIKDHPLTFPGHSWPHGG